MRYQITTFQWLQLPSETRQSLAKVFQIQKHGNSSVYGNRIISDGYTNQDLAGITVEKINIMLGTEHAEKDILHAFEEVVDYLNTNTKENNNEKRQEQSSGPATSTEEQGTDRDGNEDEGADGEDHKDDEHDLPASAKKASAKTPRSGKTVGKASANSK